MGVSLQTYRARIGIFQPTLRCTKVKTTGPTPSSKLPMKVKALLMTLFMCYCSLVAVKLNAESVSTSNQSVFYPSGSSRSPMESCSINCHTQEKIIQPEPWPPPVHNPQHPVPYWTMSYYSQLTDPGENLFHFSIKSSVYCDSCGTHSKSSIDLSPSSPLAIS